MRRGGGAKRPKVEGGNSAVAVLSAKKNRYGNEQWKIRYPTHQQYCLRLLTYTTAQLSTVDNQDEYNPGAVFPATPVTNQGPFPGYNVVPEGGRQPYWKLRPQEASAATNGEVSLNSCGLYWHWGEHLPSLNCPWLETYFAFKLDAQGFNLCDPLQFNQGRKQYMYAKQGPSCATFVWPDPPIGKGGPVRRYYNIAQPTFAEGNGTLSSYAASNIEERGIGAWEMILIPPRKLRSISIQNLCDQNAWDELIDMGFKPRPTTKVVKIYSSNGGLDVEDLQDVTAASAQYEERNFNAKNQVSFGNIKFRKHKYLDTEDICQYTSTTVSTTELNPTSYPGTTDICAQGYDAIPMGSAVVFRFRQFAPVQETITTDMEGVATRVIAQTCVRQTIPCDIYLDSVTTFKQPVKGAFDIDQLLTNPAVDFRPGAEP